MESVAGFVQQRPHVVVNADRVHEDQWLFPEVEGLAVGPRRLALAVLKVEQFRIHHRLVVPAEVGIDMPEDAGGAINESLNVGEWLEGRPSERVDKRVP